MTGGDEMHKETVSKIGRRNWVYSLRPFQIPLRALVAIPILISIALAVPAGRLTDRGYISHLTLGAPFLSCLDFILLSFPGRITKWSSRAASSKVGL